MTYPAQWALSVRSGPQGAASEKRAGSWLPEASSRMGLPVNTMSAPGDRSPRPWTPWSNRWEFGFIGTLGVLNAPFYAGRAPRDLAWLAGIRR